MTRRKRRTLFWISSFLLISGFAYWLWSHGLLPEFRRSTPVEIYVTGSYSHIRHEFRTLTISNPNDFALNVRLTLNEGRWICEGGHLESYESIEVRASDFLSRDNHSRRLPSIKRWYKLEIHLSNWFLQGTMVFDLSDLRDQ